MHVGVALQSISDIAHRGHFSVVLQQDGVIGNVGVTVCRRRQGLLLHIHAVVVKLDGHVQMSGSIGGAWHKKSPRNKLQHMKKKEGLTSFGQARTTDGRHLWD